MDNITSILAIWGALLSTLLSIILAVLRFKEFRYNSIRQIRFSTTVDSSCESLYIEIINDGKRPVTVTDVEIIYGTDSNNGQLVGAISTDLPKKLNESDPWSVEVNRNQLIVAVREKKVEQRYYHHVWVVVSTTMRQKLIKRVRIPLSIIKDKYPYAAGPWIAADLFLGFSQMESKGSPYPPLGVLFK